MLEAIILTRGRGHFEVKIKLTLPFSAYLRPCLIQASELIELR